MSGGNTAAVESQAEAHLEPSASDIRLVIGASSAGTVFEWYDFFIYGTLAGIIGKTFFPSGNATLETLLVWAGFAVGFGDAMNSSAITTMSSGLGVTQTLNTDQATKAGAGRGIAQAGRDLQKFLLDLGKQAVPVVEVGAMRPVTVVISEGVEIEVKDIPNTCMGGNAACVN